MQSKKGFKDAGMVIGILAIVLFGIIIYATASPSDTSATDLDDETDIGENFTAELLSATPGIIEQAGEINVTELEIELEEFSISGIPTEQTERLSDEGEKVVVKQSAFSGTNFAKTVVANQNTVAATVIFDVEFVSGNSELMIYVNNKKLATKQANSGDVERFNIPIANLNIGKNENETSENLIEIKVSKPSWIFFWKTNSVTLKDIYFVQQIFDTEIAKKDFTLDFESDEVIGLDSATLETKVRLPEGAGSKKLIISFQGEIVYDSVPSAKETFDVEIPTTLFDSGENTLTFKTELEGGYDISGVFKYSVADMPDGSYKEYKVTIGENIWPYIENGQTEKGYECTLALQKSSGDDAIKVWINNHRMEYSFVNDEIEVNVCNYLTTGENSIKLISKDFIRLDRVTLRIEEK